MPNVLLTIQYDGTQYHGWQVQKNALTVQEVLQDALENVFQMRPDVKGCSRTDTGVHANMYCVSFHAPFYTDEYHMVCAINRFLPADIRANACREVDDDFHARYHTTAKEYIYYFYNGKFETPFLNRYAFHYPYTLDEKRLNDAAQAFVGTHDFKTFCAAHTDIHDTVRTVYSCTVTREGEMLKMTICADGFLYNMVRIIAGTLIDVAKGKTQPEQIPCMIAAKDRKLAGKTLAAKGLFLNKVYYGGLDFESR